jgi:ferritin
MLSEKIESALNDQISKEANSSFTYLSIAVWCERNGLEGNAQFFYRQAQEEHMHMMKLIHYVVEMDGKAIIPPITEPKKEFESIQNVFKITLSQEKEVTQSIHKIIDLANEASDHTTQNFLQWYVAEQREEESLIRKILDKIMLIGDGPQSLYYIDKEIERINQSVQNLPPTPSE